MPVRLRAHGVAPWALPLLAQPAAALFFLTLTVGGLAPSVSAASGYWLAALAAECGWLVWRLLRGRPLTDWPAVPLLSWIVGSLVFIVAVLTAVRALGLSYPRAAALGALLGFGAQLALSVLADRGSPLAIGGGWLRWRLSPVAPPLADRRPGPMAASLLLSLAGGVALTLLMTVVALPWRGNGLDDAWVRVITWAQQQGLVFGRDIIFTYGPLGSLFTYPPGAEALSAKLIYSASYATLFASGLWLLAGGGWRWALLLTWVLVILAMPHDYSSSSIAAFALLTFLVGREPGRLPWSLFACGLLAVMALGKLSHLPTVLLPVLALDLDRWLQARRLPLFLPAFLAAVMLAQLAAGQPLDALLDLVVTVAQAGSGYAEAMQIEEAVPQIALLLLLFVLLALVNAVGVTRLALGSAAQGRRWSLLPLLTAAIGFLAWKSAMVRGHGHAWPTGVELAALSLLAPGGLALRRAGALLPLVISVAAFLLFMTVLGFQLWSTAANSPIGYFDSRIRMFQTVLQGTAYQKLSQQAADIDAAIRAEQPWPAVTGSVDVLGHRQGPALAWGLDYRPRPLFQSYAVQTLAGAMENLAFYRSARAPQNVFADWLSIDGRWPGSDDGPVRLELLARYRAIGAAGDYLQFERLPAVRALTLTPLSPVTVTYDTLVEVPDAGPLFAQITLNHSLLGRLTEALWRAPVFKVVLELADGSRRTYRIVPQQAAAGFVLTPLVTDLDSALRFYQSDGRDPALADLRVVGLWLKLATAARWFYSSAIEVRFFKIEVAPP